VPRSPLKHTTGRDRRKSDELSELDEFYCTSNVCKPSNHDQFISYQPWLDNFPNSALERQLVYSATKAPRLGTHFKRLKKPSPTVKRQSLRPNNITGS